ncbi:DUF1926 domain-containing protein [Spirochaetota bacterium]
MFKMNLIIGCYNHVPEGMNESEIETIYQSCYRPFLSALNRFPDIQATFYYSGSLLNYLEAKHPEYIMLLGEMSARRQIELLGGGFYAPLLPIIPGSDRLGQIELLTTYLRKSFGKRPRGCWLTEYAWEPSLASTLQTAGMDYAFLSAKQFENAMGQKTAECFPVITEDQGRCVTILPVIDCTPGFGSFNGYIEAAEKGLAYGQGNLAVIMAAGESIRELWEQSGLESPDIYMENTFAWFRKNFLQLESITASKFVKACRTTSRLYFTGSASSFIKQKITKPGRNWDHSSVRSLILRYASSSALYSKMLYTHLLISQLRGDKARKKSAGDDLWKGQCGNSYWIDPLGGISRPALREAAYRALIDAELTTRQKGVFMPGIVKADLDFDTNKEYIYQGNEMNAYVHAKGASLMELDALKARRNICDIFTDEEDVLKARRLNFVDRVYAKKPNVENAEQPWLNDLGVFSEHIYDEAQLIPDQPELLFAHDGINKLQGEKYAFSIAKRYQFIKKTVKVSYKIQNRSEKNSDFWLGTEFNISGGAAGIESVEFGSQDRPLIKNPVNETIEASEKLSKIYVKLKGSLKTVTISSTQPFICFSSAIVSMVNQGLGLLLYWPVSLINDKFWINDISLSFTE